MLKGKLQEALKSAMKSKDKIKLDTIRLLLSALQYEEIQRKTEDLPSELANSILQREVGKRREEIEYAEQSGRTEQKEKLLVEIAFIEEFLPKQLSNGELEKIITNLKAENPSINLGLAMKALKDGYGGQYDGKAASELAKKILG